MKLLQALVIITTCIFLSCSKSSTPAPQPKGTLVFQNNSTNPYQVFVNGKSVVSMQPGRTIKSVTYVAGPCSIRVIQLEGYFLYPFDKTFNGELKSGGTLVTVFP